MTPPFSLIRSIWSIALRALIKCTSLFPCRHSSEKKRNNKGARREARYGKCACLFGKANIPRARGSIFGPTSSCAVSLMNPSCDHLLMLQLRWGWERWRGGWAQSIIQTTTGQLVIVWNSCNNFVFKQASDDDDESQTQCIECYVACATLHTHSFTCRLFVCGLIDCQKGWFKFVRLFVSEVIWGGRIGTMMKMR